MFILFTGPIWVVLIAIAINLWIKNVWFFILGGVILLYWVIASIMDKARRADRVQRLRLESVAQHLQETNKTGRDLSDEQLLDIGWPFILVALLVVLVAAWKNQMWFVYLLGVGLMTVLAWLAARFERLVYKRKRLGDGLRDAIDAGRRESEAALFALATIQELENKPISWGELDPARPTAHLWRAGVERANEASEIWERVSNLADELRYPDISRSARNEIAKMENTTRSIKTIVPPAGYDRIEKLSDLDWSLFRWSLGRFIRRQKIGEWFIWERWADALIGRIQTQSLYFPVGPQSAYRFIESALMAEALSPAGELFGHADALTDSMGIFVQVVFDWVPNPKIDLTSLCSWRPARQEPPTSDRVIAKTQKKPGRPRRTGEKKKSESPSEKSPLDILLADFDAWLRSQSLAGERSRRSTDLSDFARWLYIHHDGMKLSPECVTREIVSRYTEHLSIACSQRRVTRAIVSLSLYERWTWHQAGLDPNNQEPQVRIRKSVRKEQEPPPGIKPEKRWLMRIEREALVRYIKIETSRPNYSFPRHWLVHLRRHTIALLILSTGLSDGEVRKLCASHVDFNALTITGPGDGAIPQRVIPLSDAYLCSLLQKWTVVSRAATGKLLFGKTVYKDIAMVGRGFGMAITAGILRRTFAYTALDEGVNPEQVTAWFGAPISGFHLPTK